MLVEDAEVRGRRIELRQQAHYRRAQHARATEREEAWKDKAQCLERIVRRQQAQITELTHELEEALARIAWLEAQVFGRKSEQCPKPNPDAHDSIPVLDHNADVVDEPEPCDEPRRKRGKQPGTKGYGRTRRHALPAEEAVHDLPEDRRRCPLRGKLFEIFPGTEDSEQIEWEVNLSRCIHKPVRYCGRLFTTEEMDWIRRLMASEPKLNRAQLSRQVCDELHWLRPDGRSKEMSCRVAMLRLERDGLITLPRPQKGNGNGRNRPRLTAASDLKEPLSLPARAVTPLEFRPVDTPGDSLLWNELIERYHYLKYKPLPGAQMRYLLFHGSYLPAAMGFSATVWKVAPRDRFIGWDDGQRRRNLHRIVNNSRFLILPWVEVRNLASCILGAAAKRLGNDWKERYGYEPVLLETFVERSRFRGTCYRAANWIHVGDTQGGGKLDRRHRGLSTIKHIYLHPLHNHFRQKLYPTPDE